MARGVFRSTSFSSSYVLAIAMTTILLGLGLGVLMLSGFPPVRDFALLALVTLTGALGDLLILPAILPCFRPVRTTR